MKRAIRQGEPRAIEHIYNKYKPFISKYIGQLGYLDGFVDDLVEDVFLCISEGKFQYSGKTDVQGYLCGIAKNVTRTHLRNSKEYPFHAYPLREDDTPTESGPFVGKIVNPQKDLTLEETEEALEKSLAGLPEKSRQAVELVVIQGFRPFQAAAKAGCSPVVLRNRLCHGLRKLRKDLGKSVKNFEL